MTKKQNQQFFRRYHKVHSFQALDGVKLRLERVTCICNPHYCKYTVCNVKAKSRDISNLNLNITIKEIITVQMAKVKMFYQFSNNEYRPVLIDFSGNICASVSGSTGVTFWKVMKNALGNKTNIVQRCPYQRGEYYIKDFNFNASHLPSILPVGRYLIKIHLSTYNNEPFHNVSIYFNVANYGILDLNMGWYLSIHHLSQTAVFQFLQKWFSGFFQIVQIYNFWILVLSTFVLNIYICNKCLWRICDVY